MKNILVVLFVILISQQVVQCLDQLTIKDKLGSLDSQTSIKVYPADTGYVPYGQDWDGILVLANPLDACQQLNMNVSNPNNKKIFILAKRGQCKFVDKADNVQYFGAQALIIADNQHTDLEHVNIMDITQNQFFISIMVINQENGNKLLQGFNTDNKTQINAHLQFDLFERSKIIDYQYFFSSLQLSSYDFIQNLLNIYDTFHSEDRMNIIFEIYTFLDLYGYDKSGCIGDKYCALDPDLDGPLTGKDQIKFDLNILCLQEQMASGSEGTKNFLRYLIDFREFCLMVIPLKEAQLYELNDCFFKIYEKEKNYYQFEATAANFKYNIEKCAQDSQKNAQSNPLLDESREKLIEYGVLLSPELFINGQRIHGNLGNSEELSDLLCHISQSPPSECNLEMEDSNLNSSKGKIALIVILSILFGVLFILIALFCYRRSLKIKLREDVNETVQSVVSSYMAMHEGK